MVWCGMAKIDHLEGSEFFTPYQISIAGELVREDREDDDAQIEKQQRSHLEN